MSTVNQRSQLLVPVLLLAACASPDTQGNSAQGVESSVDLVLPEAGLSSVSEDLRIEPGEYQRPVSDGEAVIVLEGLRNVVLDLRQVSLWGTPFGTAADQGHGWGILIRDCEGIEIRGGTFGGYREGIRVERSDGVVLEGMEFNPVLGQRLGTAGGSGDPYAGLELDIKSPASMLEAGGAAIAILDSSRVDVSGVTARGGQNGIILVRSENCAIENNDMSYLSGFGIALQASDHNTLTGNRCDGVTRRFHGGRTESDHGATGLLLTAGSSDNVVSGNLARGGTAGIRELAADGIACVGNRFVANDLSNSSRVAVDVVGSEGGWWLDNQITGGEGCAFRVRSSSNLALCDNHIEGILGAGIKISAGERVLVRGNRFIDCDTALDIEGDGDALEHWIGQNHFSANIQDLVLEQASGLEFWQNDFEHQDGRAHLDGLTAEGNPELAGHLVWGWLKDNDGHLPSGRSSQSQLRWASPQPPAELAGIAAWQNSAAAGVTRPSAPHVAESPEMGEFGPLDPDPTPSTRRIQRSAGILERMQWQGTWFAWDKDSDPRGPIERWRARRFEPLVRSQVGVWTNPWGNNSEVQAELPETQFGLIASGTLHVERSGEYLLSAISDDGVRIVIDGEVVLEDWAWHPERRRTQKIELAAGSHPMEVEYFQMDGTAVLSLDLQGPTGL